MTTLPADAQARIERALAESLAVIWIQQHPIPWTTPDGDGDYLQIGPSPTDRLRTEVLAALATIVDVVTATGLSAADRRQTVAASQDQLLTQYAIPRVPFDNALRTQPFWERFQQTLREGVRGSRSKKLAAHADVPSFGQQLQQVMDETRVSVEWLEEETKIGKRSIYRLKNDECSPRISTVRTLEAALTKARNGVPFRFLLPATRAQRRKPPSSRKRSQKVTKRQ